MNIYYTRISAPEQHSMASHAYSDDLNQGPAIAVPRSESGPRRGNKWTAKSILHTDYFFHYLSLSRHRITY